MGTLENLSLLTGELRAARERILALAERTTALQRRLRTDAPTIVSLDKLAHASHPPTPLPAEGERFEGEEAQLGSDFWEISLINEEG